MAKTARRTNRTDLEVPTKLRNRAGLSENPELDLTKMTHEEVQLFNDIVKQGMVLIHNTHPIQQVQNQKIFFSSSIQSALFFAGMCVSELRKMQE